MKENPTLAKLLTRYMAADNLGATRLAGRVHLVTGRSHLLSRRTIENWRDGRSVSVRDWRQMVGVAAALRLDKQHANELLLSARLPTIDELRGSAQGRDEQLLEPWSTDSLSEPLLIPDWDALRDTAARITEQQMGTLLDKYDPKLYVQRDDVYQTLHSFLTSDKGCFVLTGRSGVGKSSFVLSLISGISGRNTLCLLAYDGARMPYRAGLSTVIGRDMDKFGERTFDSGSNVFERLESEQMMEGKILLLVIDAINENGQSRKLLREIDHLVGDARYPWLKVLITCRPYAWRLLCRGMRLAEHRYYRPVDDKIAHLGPDRLAIELPPFSLEELQVAYDHYCQVYGLTTPYESLAPPVREMLRDPLVLRLITQTFQSQTLSAYLRPSQIIERFLHAMISGGRLLEQDLLLLELGVMPLMFDDGSYRNKVSAEQIHSAATSDDKSLWREVFGADFQNQGQIGNSSFTRLVDAGILAQHGTYIDYEIAFKFERFFDYFGGRRLFKLADSAGEGRWQCYRDWCDALEELPFLWGPIDSALITELTQYNDALILSLAQSLTDTMSTLLVAVLTTYGEDNPDRVSQLIGNLMSSHEITWRTDSEIMGSAKYEEQPDLHRLVAVEVAGNLEMKDALASAARDDSPIVRMHVARELQHLCYRVVVIY